MNHDSSQNTSYSNSTKASANAIPNLSEKLRILGGDVSFSVDKRTVIKRRKPNTAGTTVKRRDAILDLSTCLDETRQGVDPRQLPEPLVREKCRALDFKRMGEEFEDIVGHLTLDVKEQILAPEALQRLRGYEFNKGKESREQPGMDFDYDTGNTLFDQEFMAPTSQNTGNPEESTFSSTLHEELDSKFLRGEKTITL